MLQKWKEEEPRKKKRGEGVVEKNLSPPPHIPSPKMNKIKFRENRGWRPSQNTHTHTYTHTHTHTKKETKQTKTSQCWVAPNSETSWWLMWSKAMPFCECLWVWCCLQQQQQTEDEEKNKNNSKKSQTESCITVFMQHTDVDAAGDFKKKMPVDIFVMEGASLCCVQNMFGHFVEWYF